MKKNIFVLATACAALLLTGCNQAKDNSSISGSEEPASSIVVNQDVAVESVSLDKQTLDLALGATAQLTATIAPENATNKFIIWSTEDINVATVRNGEVKAVGYGETKIVVRTQDGGKIAECVVTVKEQLKTVNVNLDSNTKSVRVVNGELKGNTITAREGTVVYVFPTYDTNKLVLARALLGNEICGTADGGVYFKMPKEAATLKFEYNEIKAPDVYKQIINVDSDTCLIGGIAGEVKVGEKVRFSIIMKNGYNFVGPVAVNPAVINEHINVASVGENLYEFTMPNDDVKISCPAEAANFALSCAEDEVVTQFGGSSILNRVVVDGTTYNGTFAKYGSQVRVETYMTQNYYMAHSLTYTAGGETFEYLFDEEGAVEFTMPAYAVNFTITGTYHFVPLDIDCDPRVQVVGCYEYYNSSLYYHPYDEIGAYYSEYCVIAIDVGMNEYPVKQVVVEPFSYYSSSYGGTKASSKTARRVCNMLGRLDETTYLYYFQLANRPAEHIKITITTQDMSKFEDAGIDGLYFGFPTYAAAKDAVFSSTYTSQILTSGYGIFAGAYGDVKEYNKITGLGTYTVIDSYGDPKDLKFYNKNGIMVSAQSSTVVMQNTGTNPYNYVFVRAESEDDEQADYSANSVTFNNGLNVAVQVLHNGEPYFNAFIDYANEKVYAGNVNYKFIAGSKVTDLNNSFEVYYGQRLLAKVCYSPVDKKWVPVTDDMVSGTFKGAQGDLVLGGFGSGSLNGDPITYTLNGNNLSGKNTVTKAKFTLVIEPMFKEYMRYEEIPYVAPAYLDKTYQGVGTFYYSSNLSDTNSSNYNALMTVTFLEDDLVDWMLYTESVKKSGNFNTKFSRISWTNASAAGKSTYTVDEATNRVSITFVFYYNSVKSMTWQFQFNDDYSSLTILTAKTYANTINAYDYFFLNNPLVVAD
ncbi:MAG: Ig-like domain-containing protein [Bacilli bacterium]|nr:Ig-like domain-containing protein [Bacilli bacterium]